MKKQILAFGVLAFLFLHSVSADELSGKTFYSVFNMKVLKNGKMQGFLAGRYTFSANGTYKFEEIKSMEDSPPKSYSITEYTLSPKGIYWILENEIRNVLIKVSDSVYLFRPYEGNSQEIIYLDEGIYWLVTEEVAKEMILNNPDLPNVENY